MNGAPEYKFHSCLSAEIQETDDVLVIDITKEQNIFTREDSGEAQQCVEDSPSTTHVGPPSKPSKNAKKRARGKLEPEVICTISGKGLRIPTEVHPTTTTTMSLIDSGATIDVISSQFFKTVNPMSTQPYKGPPISVANKATIQPTITALLRFKILGKWVTNWFVVIPGLSHDVILGLPFQHRMGMIMDCKTRQIHFTRIKSKYFYSYPEENVNDTQSLQPVGTLDCWANRYTKLLTNKGMVIKPRSRNVVSVHISNPIPQADLRDGFVTGSWELPNNLKVMTGLATLTQHNNGNMTTCDIVLINLGNRAYQLSKNEHIANFTFIREDEIETLISITLEEQSILHSNLEEEGDEQLPGAQEELEETIQKTGQMVCDVHNQPSLETGGEGCAQCHLEINLVTPTKDQKKERSIESMEDKPEDLKHIELAIQQFRLCDTYLPDKDVYKWARMLMTHLPVWDPDNAKKPIKRTDKVECHIELQDDIPVERRYTTKDPVLHEIERKHILKMYERNIIQPSKSNYAQPIILADKKNGKIRFCVDYRGINAKTKKFCYPLPRMDEILMTLGKAKHFSLIDQSEAFWSIPLAKESRHKTAFISRSGLWEFLSMPFGLKNAPAMQQSFLDAILSGLSWKCCICYVDDIVIFSNTIDDHLEHVSEILSRLQENNLTITADKADLCMPSFDILGFRATKDGIVPGDKHLKAIKEFPQPTTVKEVQSFLGLVNFLRRFIPQCSLRQRSLQNIIVQAKKGKVTLEKLALKEFLELKDTLQRYPCLIHPNMSKPFYIHVDASGTGYGAILTQRTKDLEGVLLGVTDIPKGITKDHQVIAYASIALPKAHANYNNPEREASAMKWAVENFKHYIIGKQVIIFTDHQTFEYSINQRPAQNTTSKNQIIAKCAAVIQQFDPIILHRPGKAMVIPDTLSRIHHLERVQRQTGEGHHHQVAAVTRRQAFLATSAKSPRTNPIKDKTPTNPTSTPPIELSDQAQGIEASQRGNLESRKRKRPETSLHPPPAVDESSSRGSTLREWNLRISDPGRIPQPDQKRKKPRQGNQEPEELTKLRRAQLDDPYCQTIRACITQAPVSNDNPDTALVLRQASLFYYDHLQIIRRKMPKRSMEIRNDPVVLPRSMVEDTIDKYHHPPFSGHAKYDKIMDILEQRFWFQGMRDFVKAYVQSCHSCQRAKPSVTWEGQAKPFQGEFPNHIVHLDFTKGTGVTTKGNTHILAIIDNFTNFLRLYPVRAVDAETAALSLLEYITTLSCPVRIVCDNGSEFRNALIDALSSALNIVKVHISPYHSQANGKVENVHRNIKTMLRSYIENYVNDWDTLLPMLQLAHNSHISKSTGFSPFYLMHGFPPILPVDTPSTQIPNLLTKDEYVLRLQSNLAKVFSFVKHHRKLKMAEREEAMNDKNKNKLVTLEKGQLVLMRSHKLQKKFNKKLLPKAQGEFFIVDNRHGDHYELRDPLSMKLYPERVHIGQLIKYNYRLSDTEKQRLCTDRIAVQHLPTTTRVVDEPEKDNVYEVEQIKGCAKMEDGSIRFQVKWKGFPFRPRNKNSWVDEQDLYAPDLLRRYKNTPEYKRIKDGITRVA